MNTSVLAVPSALAADDILTIDEVARRLGVTRRWVYERTRKRSRDPIPHTRFGKKTLRFSWQRISDWWRAHERNVGGAS